MEKAAKLDVPAEAPGISEIALRARGTPRVALRLLRRVRDYAQALAETIPVPLHFWDERLTTFEASELMRAQGKSVGKDWIDAVAAAVILQSYLDAHTS